MAMQEKKLCHFVGSFCSKKMAILGKCMENKKAYCCFNSKISRVIMQQGKNQLGKEWGSPETPDCKGFTPDELAKLQFDKMDLNEIAIDIEAQVKVPDKNMIESKVKKTVEDYGKNHN
jgi:conjugal transfer mating pair stabilization protein TraN